MSTGIDTLVKEKTKLDEPGLYDVIFLNDNITTMEFVVRVLKQIFVDALSSPDVNTETLDYVRSFLETEKFEVLGITKKAKYDKNGKLIILGYNRRICQEYADDRVRKVRQR